jgi:hypothetical protein
MITSNIENFIGIYENVLDSNECLELISYYESMAEIDLAIEHTGYSQSPSHIGRKDKTVFMLDKSIISIPETSSLLKNFLPKFWACYNDYASEYSSIQDIKKIGMHMIRFQKTSPGGGFHYWHFENGGFEASSRVIAFQIYLNDILDGGETEFLYYSRRIKPESGKLIIWPAGFTHTHRGNPPLKDNKYLLTGWLYIIE